MINLDEAIKYCEEVAEKNEKKASWFWGKEGNSNYEKCVECASERRQLVELLRELKTYRIAHYKLRDMDYEYDFNSKFGDNPMYYGEKVWDLFGGIDEHQDEVMGYEEVNADE